MLTVTLNFIWRNLQYENFHVNLAFAFGSVIALLAQIQRGLKMKMLPVGSTD